VSHVPCGYRTVVDSSSLTITFVLLTPHAAAPQSKVVEEHSRVNGMEMELTSQGAGTYW
jgi:hypothetical protein